MNIFKYLKTACVTALFAWIALFPQPVQDSYWLHIKIFSGLFLLFLALNKKYLRHLFSFQDWPLWLFLLCLLSGIACATSKNTALKTYLYLVTNFFTLFYIGKALFRFDEDRELVSIVISVCCAIIVVIGIVQLFFAESIFYRYFIFGAHYRPRDLRLQSTQYNPIVLGSFLLGSLPFNFYFLRGRSLYRRILGIFCSLLCVIVILLTFSMAAFLGLTAALSFWLWKKERKKILIMLLGLLVLFAVTFSLQKSVNFKRLSPNRILLSAEKDNYRFKLVIMSLKMFRDHPFFGVGFNHFRIKFLEYYDKAKELPRYEFRLPDNMYPPYEFRLPDNMYLFMERYDRISGRPHYEFRVPDNMYLALLSETGIVGALGFFVFIFFLFRRGLKNFNRLKYENTGRAALIALTALTGLLVNMAAYELFYWNNPYMLFCLICGFIQGAMVDINRT